MKSQNGPVVSLNRMAKSMGDQGLICPRQASAWRNALNVYVVQAPRIALKPYVLRVDGIAVDSHHTLGNSDKMNAPIFRSIRGAAGMFYISEFSKKLVEAFSDPLPTPHVIIHNSVDLDRFSNVGANRREELGWSPNDLVFVASAKWRRWKRLPETLELFQRIKKDMDRPCRLLILGGGEHVPSSDPDVVYIGGQPPQTLPEWYRTGDVYLHLATLEPCGNTQIEAMACGLPVLCGPNGGIGETVRKANGGIVSCCDAPYHFKRIDQYHPAPPDYSILTRDLWTLLENLDQFKANIQRETLDVHAAARELAEFLLHRIGHAI